VYLGSARTLNPSVVGFSCMLNPGVYGFNLYAEPKCGWVQPKEVGHGDVMTWLGVGRECIMAQLGVWARRKHNPILGYDVRVMTFKWGVFRKPSISILSFHYLFFFIIATIKLLPYLLLACDIVFFITAMNFVQQNCPTRSSLLIFFINHHNPFV
jgi:hypothetical protein